ncbi:MAG TPA: hypothetical protein VNG53_02335 [Bacteroidia bacterium]|nr:hypothetical protein [Bacteroidia bacterium]
MPVSETGVSYYGISYVEHAKKDFEEMRKYNCNAVLLALTEFDLFFWKPNISKIVDVAKKAGLKVYLNTWGIGKFFGGEPPSVFLQECSIFDKQWTALTGEPIAAASPSSPAFREYFWNIVQELARTCNADGFFWDEPHYAMPVYPISYQSTTDFTCRNPLTQKKFLNKYGYEMPKILTQTVLKFRFDEANEILSEASRIVKSENKGLTVTQCSLPADNHFYSSYARGFDDWERTAFNPNYDIFSTSILVDGNDPISAHKNLAKKTVELARLNNKKSQRWIQSFFRSPENLQTLKKIIKVYAEEGVDSIFSWTYRAGKGTFLSAPEPDKVWSLIGEAYGEVLNA